MPQSATRQIRHHFVHVDCRPWYAHSLQVRLVPGIFSSAWLRPEFNRIAFKSALENQIETTLRCGGSRITTAAPSWASATSLACGGATWRSLSCAAYSKTSSHKSMIRSSIGDDCAHRLKCCIPSQSLLLCSNCWEYVQMLCKVIALTIT